MTKIFTLSLAALALAAATVSATANAETRPMTEVDLATLDRLGSPTVSPDEKWAVVAVTETDADSYDRSSALYLVDLVNPQQAMRRIVDKADASEHSPSFAPDGRLWYLSDAEGGEELWHVSVSANGKTGKPVRASDLTADIAGFKISPTGDMVAVWGDIALDCPTFGCEEEGNRAETGPGTGRLYVAEDGFVRHWSSWETPGNYSRLFSFDIEGGKLTGDGYAISGNLQGDVPSKPFGGGEEIAWTANGSGFAFALRKADRNEPKSTNLEIWGTSAKGGSPSNMTSGNDATDSLPAFSPDGQWLAWAAMERPGYESDRMVVKLRQRGSNEIRSLTEDWDRSVGSIAWTHDSKALIVTASDVLDHPAYRVDLADGKVTRLTGQGYASNVIPMKDGSIVYTLNSAQSPPELYRKAPASAAVRLTDINGEAMAEIDEVSVERFSFKGAEGDTVWGQIIKPRTDAKLPLAFYIHGGPQGSFSDSWSTRWNYKTVASQGYAVVTVDFHGSAGYGQAFKDSINRDWGGKPLTDLKLGLDAALAKDPQIDGDRACALGASYGGYMLNWIQGNWPDRFDCIVNHAGIFDLRSFAFSTEEHWFDRWDHGGAWWERANPEKWNPLNHIDKWQTPTLFIHGEKDFRIPYTQSIMPFSVLQDRDIPAKLLIFPDENHWVLKGKNSVQWHRTVFDWLKRWTKEGGE